MTSMDDATVEAVVMRWLPVSEDDIATCDWGYCERPSVVRGPTGNQFVYLPACMDHFPDPRTDGNGIFALLEAVAAKRLSVGVAYDFVGGSWQAWVEKARLEMNYFATGPTPHEAVIAAIAQIPEAE